MSHWSSDYIGRPWGPTFTKNCWAFLSLVQRERFGRDTGRQIELFAALSSGDDSKIEDLVERLGLVEVETPSEGDFVMMGTASGPAGHCGVWIDCNGGMVMHADDGGIGAIAQRLSIARRYYSPITFMRPGSN